MQPTRGHPMAVADDDDIDGVDPLTLLPAEIWNLIVAGDTTVDGHLEPRWRFAARSVCRLWRDLIGAAAPSLRGWRWPATFKDMHRAVGQALWVRGRIVTASALVSVIASVPSDWTPARVTTWIAGAGGSQVDAARVMILSQVPHLVAHAIDVVLPQHIPPVDMPTETRQRRVRLSLAEASNDPWHRLVDAAIRTGDTTIVDAVVAHAPDVLRGDVALRAAAETGNLDILDRVLASGPPNGGRVLEVVLLSRNKATATHMIAGLIDPHYRSWAPPSDQADWWLPQGINLLLAGAIKYGSAHVPEALIDAGFESDVDRRLGRVRHRRSVAIPQWCWERERAKGEDRAHAFMAKLVPDTVFRNVDDNGRPYSLYPERLLAWACDGPPRWDPLAKDVDVCASLRGLIEHASHPIRGDPHCFAWLCGRYPREVAAMDAIVEWTAQAARALFCPPHGSVGGVASMERFVSAIDAVWTHMPPDRRHRLETAVDLWPLALSARPCHLDPTGARARVDHAMTRSRGDDPHRIAAAYAECRAAAAYAEIGPHRVPFCVHWASHDAWRRWCRIPPDGDRAAPCRSGP
ncbi:hypothetical protein TW95_gp1195 [Pandoravirus inopinatum]|uniref:Ankyrin repeat protein n=1 Tax=Pandoravirus inopinatum TaxID=1605721 RepID=A0A0B5J2W8_9VIRU|nr:hypothetical protein TW95_gp1195 [Pandoravirus inopinatum]AJF97929.1 hypothetical protein [Pandoravirus inopinatum]